MIYQNVFNYSKVLLKCETFIHKKTDQPLFTKSFHI